MDHHDEDERWDYDCPQFVDFTVPMPFNDGADQMFESTVMGEGPTTSTLQFLNQGVELVLQEEEKNAQEQPAEKSAEGEKVTEKTETHEEPNDKSKERVLDNVVTSLEQWRNRGKHASSGPDEASNSKKPRRSAEKALRETRVEAAPKPTLARSKSVRIPKSSSVSALNSTKTAVQNEASGSRPLRSHTRTLSRGRSSSHSNSMDLGSVAGESKAHNTTGGKSSKMPSLLKRLGEAVTSSKAKSTEELEMERIKQLKKELQHKRQMAQESYKKAMSKAAPVAVHSSKGPTMPQEFHFQTESRLKMQGEKAEKSVGDFVKSLRSRTVVSPGPSSSGPKKATIPQPFNLTEKHGSSSQLQQAESKFQSMAEKVTAFHKRTPERFRARARSGDSCHKRGARSVSPPRLTQPHTPNLTARTRHRPNHYPSQKELEEKEIEEMKQNQFKARPVNTKVLSSSNLGIKKVPSKPVTEPEEFALSSGVARKREVEEEHYEFHANPLNKKILEGPVGVKPVKPALPTVPMSPAFALKHRVRLPVEVPEDKADTSGSLRAKPVPHTGIPFQPKLSHQHTVPEPFSVEERSKAMLAQREEKIRQALEEEKKAREFHAQPLPSLEPFHPEKLGKGPTKPEPFQLETDQRGARYVQELAHKVGKVQLTEEEEEQRRAAQFKAQPNRTIYKEPFVPAKSSKALTEVSDFELNTDRRAVQREEFEMHKKEIEMELEGRRRQREQQRQEEEKAAIAKLRAEMVHRPNPVRHFNPVIVKPSDKPLTEAESPRFSDRLRAKVRL